MVFRYELGRTERVVGMRRVLEEKWDEMREKGTEPG